MGYFLRALNARTDKAKLMKLMYIADRDHFILHSAPITGDVLCAMPKGPVPSKSLDLLNGEYLTDWDSATMAHLGLEDYTVLLKDDPGVSRLSETEIAVLDKVIKDHGHKRTWALVEETHNYPEYKAVYVERSSRPIPYELILRFYRQQDSFRLNRAVISEAIQRRMLCPFPTDDSDL